MKSRLIVIVAAIFVFCTTNIALAVTIGFAPSGQTVNLGDTASVDLVISGLGDGVAPSLGEFDIDITFDATILAFDSITWGTFLGDPDLGEAIVSHTLTSPAINTFELSLLEESWATCVFCIPPVLEDIQPASFTLASLTFNTLSTGISPLDLSIITLADGNGDPLAATLEDGSITVVAVAAVPEPGTLLLLGFGLGAMALFGKKRKLKQDNA